MICYSKGSVMTINLSKRFWVEKAKYEEKNFLYQEGQLSLLVQLRNNSKYSVSPRPKISSID